MAELAGQSGSSSGWGNAQNILGAVQASQGFRTLRDMVPAEVQVERSRLSRGKSLGEGAFATVHLAMMDGVRPVAVKTLKPDLLRDNVTLNLFFEESKLLRRLRHKHIVEFVGMGGGQPDAAGIPGEVYLVQEFCGGGSLRDLVFKQMVQPMKKLYSAQDALRWSIQIAQALSYLHTARPKVIHRDMKLDNVLLTDSDLSKAEAKLGDFGLARLMVKKAPASMQSLQTLMEGKLTPMDSQKITTSLADNLNKLGMKQMKPEVLQNISSSTSMLSDMTSEAGSYGTMAPEVLMGKPYDETSDIFSFGVVMHSLFYRIIPALSIIMHGEEEDMVMYAYQIANGQRPDLNPAMAPAEVNQIIDACWNGIASMRPSASEVVRMLKEVQAKGVCDGKSAAGGSSQGCCSVM